MIDGAEVRELFAELQIEQEARVDAVVERRAAERREDRLEYLREWRRKNQHKQRQANLRGYYRRQGRAHVPELARLEDIFHKVARDLPWLIAIGATTR